MSKDSKNLIISKRYAESLAELGKVGKLSYNAILTNLDKVLNILDSSEDLKNTLESPLISVVDKQGVIEKVFEKDVDKLIINFLKLLVEKNRFDLIYEIAEVYKTILDEINNVERVHVTSAVELRGEQRFLIKDKLSKKLNKQINIEYNIDESIIAGLVIKIGDDVVDMSLASKLDNYKMAIIK